MVKREENMTNLLIRNKLADHIPDMIETFEKEKRHKFSRKEWKEFMVYGEELISGYFPDKAYLFSIPPEEREDFDQFMTDFVNAFVGVMYEALLAKMNFQFIISCMEREGEDK
jgi:hypothetical protein